MEKNKQSEIIYLLFSFFTLLVPGEKLMPLFEGPYAKIGSLRLNGNVVVGVHFDDLNTSTAN